MRACIRFPWFAALWLTCLPAATCFAGEIIIVEPAPKGSRSQQALDATLDKARQRKAGESADVPVDAVVVITDDKSEARRGAERAREAIEDAAGYLSPGTGVVGSETPSEDGPKVIIRKEPPTGAHRARSKARSYLEGDEESQDTRRCVVVNQVGTIGEGEGAKQGGKVVEKGNSTVVICR